MVSRVQETTMGRSANRAPDRREARSSDPIRHAEIGERSAHKLNAHNLFNRKLPMHSASDRNRELVLVVASSLTIVAANCRAMGQSSLRSPYKTRPGPHPAVQTGGAGEIDSEETS